MPSWVSQQHDLRHRLAVRRGDPGQHRIGEQVALPFGEGTPRLVLLAEAGHDLVLGQPLMEGVGLDLVDGRRDLVVLDEVHEPVAGEVGHPDRPDQALLVQVLHGPPLRIEIAERLVDEAPGAGRRFR